MPPSDSFRQLCKLVGKGTTKGGTGVDAISSRETSETQDKQPKPNTRCRTGLDVRGLWALGFGLCATGASAQRFQVKIDGSFAIGTLNIGVSQKEIRGIADAVTYFKVVEHQGHAFVCFGYMANNSHVKRFLEQGKIRDPKGRVILRNLVPYSNLKTQAQKYKATSIPGRTLNDAVQVVPLTGVSVNCRKSRSPWATSYRAKQFTIDLPTQLKFQLN